MQSGTLLEWRKKPGERVRRDEVLADLETDKVVLEVTAPADGTLHEIRVEAGAEVRPGEVLAVLETEAAGEAGVVSTPGGDGGQRGSGAPPNPRRRPQKKRLRNPSPRP